MLTNLVKYIALVFIIGRILQIVTTWRTGKVVHRHYPGCCVPVDQVEGAIDMELIPGDKILVTVQRQQVTSENNTNFEGAQCGVILLDLSESDWKPRILEISNYPHDMSRVEFHGLSCWIDHKTYEVYVFIVNRNETASSVEVFIYDEEDFSLYYLNTYRDPLFRILYDVVAVSRQSFYVTNYLYAPGSVKSKVEMLLMFRWGSLLFYDGQEASIAQADFLMPNGINKSPDGRYLYLAHAGLKEILVYRLKEGGELALVQSCLTYTLPGYVTVDRYGNIWLANHLDGCSLIVYLDNPAVKSASQVLQLKTKEGLITDIREAILDDGRLISASSVALYAKSKIFVGSPLAGTVVCDVAYV